MKKITFTYESKVAKKSVTWSVIAGTQTTAEKKVKKIIGDSKITCVEVSIPTDFEQAQYEVPDFVSDIDSPTTIENLAYAVVHEWDLMNEQ